ncbi:MFS transporter [Patulibacter minatonensis]|uniref:MFS transporter n=1 Tax=Patulibacter minatonensis TaxID=298163 RepID=UPI0004B7997F|nr:MFS transporter [Patulibacter minatonensis]
MSTSSTTPPAGAGDPAAAPAHPPGHWAPLVAVCLGTFMLLVDVTIVNVALPDMAIDLKASFAGLQWVVDVYALALAALLLLVGSIADIVGRKRTYLVGLVVFVVASLACGLAPGEGTLIAARAVQGVGAAAMFATTLVLLNTAYAGRDRGVAFGIWGATAGAAAAAGPIAGGLLTQGLSWRWVFFVNIPIGIATVVMARRSLKESKLEHRPKIDWAGGGAFTVAAGALTFALVRVTDEGWTSTQTIAMLALAVVGLIAFVVVELRSKQPLFDLSLLKRPSFLGILLAALILSLSAFGSLVCLSIWLQTVLGLGAISAGLVTLPLSGLAFFVSGAIGGKLHALSPRWIIAAGLLLIGIGDLLMTGLGGGSDWPAVLPGMAAIGLGVGLMSPMLVSTAMGAVPQERGGMAAGAINTGRQLGLAIGIAVLGSVFSSRIGDLLTGTPGERAADAVTGGGAQGVLRGAPAEARGALDDAIHHAVGSGLATVMLVAGIIGIVGALLVSVLLREPSAETAPAAGTETAAA